MVYVQVRAVRVVRFSLSYEKCSMFQVFCVAAKGMELLSLSAHVISSQLMRNEKRYLCDLSNYCHEAKIAYKPKKGAALFWYNHDIDENTGWLGDMDKMSYHGGCDVIKGTKWAANNWINVGKNKEMDQEAWRNYKEFIDDYDQEIDTNNNKKEQESEGIEGKVDKDMADVAMDTGHKGTE